MVQIETDCRGLEHDEWWPSEGLSPLTLSPEGCQIVAGGRSAAQTTGNERTMIGTLQGCQREWHPFAVQSLRAAYRRSSLRFDLRLLSLKPFGLKRRLLRPNMNIIEAGKVNLRFALRDHPARVTRIEFHNLATILRNSAKEIRG